MRGVAMRFEGALQSWGGSALGEVRPTHDAPTASGVIGLVGAALGVDRSTGVVTLTALHRALALAVRVDRRGEILVDYHTALDVPDAGGKAHSGADITYRRYLADASFAGVLVAIDEAAMAPITLDTIVAALRHPRYALSLGRRACAPSVPVLAVNEVLTGDSWSSLLAQVSPIDAARRGRDPGEVWVDGRLVDAGAQGTSVRWRDALVGPLPRMFGDRTVWRMGPASTASEPARSDDTTEGFLR
jgi:CRISPR system Cascade subunit CasD